MRISDWSSDVCSSDLHSTATCGTFAAAAAAGRLMGLDREALQRALSVAGSQSAGLRENFGTMTKPFHAGRSSESGVVAAQFAAYGWTATDQILEDRKSTRLNSSH